MRRAGGERQVPAMGTRGGPGTSPTSSPTVLPPREPCLGLEELTAALAALTKSGSVRDSGAGLEGGELQHTNDSGREERPGCAPAGRH